MQVNNFQGKAQEDVGYQAICNMFRVGEKVLDTMIAPYEDIWDGFTRTHIMNLQ